MLNWAITFLLLSGVGIFFATLGTVNEVASLLARIASVGLVTVAAAVFLAYVREKNQRGNRHRAT